MPRKQLNQPLSKLKLDKHNVPLQKDLTAHFFWHHQQHKWMDMWAQVQKPQVNKTLLDLRMSSHSLLTATNNPQSITIQFLLLHYTPRISHAIIQIIQSFIFKTMKIKRPKNIKNLTQNSIKISLRKTAMQAATLNLAQELKTEQLVPTCWTSSIVTLPWSHIEKLNQLPRSICLIKTSTLEIITTAHQTLMITVDNLEVLIALQETKAQLSPIHQSLAKLHNQINMVLQSKLKPSMLLALTQRVQSSCQIKSL